MKTKRIMKELQGILEDAKVEKGAYFTHMSKNCPESGIPQRSYYIPKEGENDFLTAVCNAVRMGVPLSITERRGEYAPLLVDFDFQATLDADVVRQYTRDDVKKLVKFYQDEIRNVVDSDKFREDMLICIVLEKEKPRVETDIVKDGFHFHFPNFICSGPLQDHYLRDKVTAKIIESKLLSKTKITTKPSKFIDERMATKVWMMYGSMNGRLEQRFAKRGRKQVVVFFGVPHGSVVFQ